MALVLMLMQVLRLRKKVEQGSKAVSEPEQAGSEAVVVRMSPAQEAQNGEILPRRKGSERKRKGELDELASAVPFADLKAGLREVCTRRRGLHLCVHEDIRKSGQVQSQGPGPRVATVEEGRTCSVAFRAKELAVTGFAICLCSLKEIMSPRTAFRETDSSTTRAGERRAARRRTTPSWSTSKRGSSDFWHSLHLRHSL